MFNDAAKVGWIVTVTRSLKLRNMFQFFFSKILALSLLND